MDPFGGSEKTLQQHGVSDSAYHIMYIYIYICNITTGNTQKNWGKGEKLSKHILLSDDHLIMARLGENDGPMKMRPVRTLTGKDWSLTEKIGS
jgi:hypothetical protein